MVNKYTLYIKMSNEITRYTINLNGIKKRNEGYVDKDEIVDFEKFLGIYKPKLEQPKDSNPVMIPSIKKPEPLPEPESKPEPGPGPLPPEDDEEDRDLLSVDEDGAADSKKDNPVSPTPLVTPGLEKINSTPAIAAAVAAAASKKEIPAVSPVVKSPESVTPLAPLDPTPAIAAAATAALNEKGTPMVPPAESKKDEISVISPPAPAPLDPTAAAVAAAAASSMNTNNTPTGPSPPGPVSPAITHDPTAAAVAAAAVAAASKPDKTPAVHPVVTSPESVTPPSPDPTAAIAAAATAALSNTDKTPIVPSPVSAPLDPTAAIAAAATAALSNTDKTPVLGTSPVITNPVSVPPDPTAAIAAAATAALSNTNKTPIVHSPVSAPLDPTAAIAAAATAALKKEETKITPTAPVTPGPVLPDPTAVAVAATAAAASSIPTPESPSTSPPLPNPDATSPAIAAAVAAAIGSSGPTSGAPVPAEETKPPTPVDTNDIVLINSKDYISYITPQGLVYYINKNGDPTIYEYEQNYINKNVKDKRKATIDSNGGAQVLKINDKPVTESNFKELYPKTIEIYGDTELKILFDKTIPYSIKAIELLQKRPESKDPVFDEKKYLSYITPQGIGYYMKKDGTDTKIYEYEQVEQENPSRRIVRLDGDKLMLTIDGTEPTAVTNENYHTLYPKTFKVYGYEGMDPDETAKIFEITKQNFIEVRDLFPKLLTKSRPT